MENIRSVSSKAIRVLHVVHSFNMGGLENGVVNLINRLDPGNFDHGICCITNSGNARSRLQRNIEFFELKKRQGNDFSVIPKLIRVIRHFKPVIVHTRNWGTVDGVIAAALTAVPVKIHGEHGWNMDDPQGTSLRRLWFRRFLSLGLNRFVAVSEDTRRWLHDSAKIRWNKISKILNGVDTDKFAPVQGGGLRAKFDVKDENVIGIVARLDPIKRHDLLFRAFAKLDHERFSLRLLVVGDGPERERLEHLKAHLACSEKITFLGEHDDVAALYNMMDIFVLPSENEGISNTILEAMACGLPVVATAVGGNRELVKDGLNGRLVSPDSPGALIKVLKNYLERPDLRWDHGAQARSIAETEFSLDRMVREYERLYLDAAKSCSSSFRKSR